MTIALSPSLERRLKDEAEKRGLSSDILAAQLIDQSLPQTPPALTPPGKPGQATIDLFEEWDREQATDDPEEIARRQADFEEFKRGMNESRLLSDGPNARIPYP